MERYTQEQLKQIDEQHEHWIREDCAGWETMKADLSKKDLRNLDFRDFSIDYVDFRGSDLRGANFEDCYFTDVNFSEADLRGASFRGAHRCGEENADFSKADLRGADFSHAGFEGVNFTDADLRGIEAYYAVFNRADFTGANLKGASFEGCECLKTDFTSADLSCADLWNSDFTEALFYGTFFDGADVSGSNFKFADTIDCNDFYAKDQMIHKGLKGVGSAENPIFHIPMACPSHGAFIGWYGVGYTAPITVTHGKRTSWVLKLEIPEDARRCSAEGEICRCDKAKLVELQDLAGNVLEDQEVTISYNMQEYTLKVGEITEAPIYEEDCLKEGPGIPFYIDYAVMCREHFGG